MSKYDPEIEQLKAGVNCATLLERMGGGYKLDQKESSRNNLKYRRGAGEIIIINHDGKGWWDPGGTAKGDVFSLAQHLDPSLNFGQVRGVLRQILGVAPSFPIAEQPEKEKKPTQPPAERWRSRPSIRQGSRTWDYLTRERQLPAEVVLAAARADAVREGPYASAWFAHRDERGGLTGIEMRGPNYRGFSEDGSKALFRLQPGSKPPTRLAVTEAPIDAMSLAAIEGMRRDTLYVATAGGMGPGTVTGLEREIAGIASRGGVLVAATDADVQGKKYVERLKAMAEAAGVPAERATPPSGHNDWNDALKARAPEPATAAYPRFSTALAEIAGVMKKPEPTTRPPWEPRPVAMAARVRAIEEREALAAASAIAAANRSEPGQTPDQRRSPSPGPGTQP